MKVKLRIDSQVTEDSVSIEASLMTESIQELVHFAQKELETIGIHYKVLGAYPIYTIQDKGKEKE